jgi:ligand-binding sensor domain-containing protein
VGIFFLLLKLYFDCMIKYFLMVLTFCFYFTPVIRPQIIVNSFLEGASITKITEEDTSYLKKGEEYIWVATYGQGIYRFSKKDGKWINFSTASKNLQNDIFHCLAVSKDYVWAGASEGLYIYDKKKNRWSMKKFSLGGEFGNWIRALYYDKDKNILWIGRFRNLTQLEVAKQTYRDFDLTQGNDPKTNTIKTIRLDGDSLVWFGTESGAHLYRKKKKIAQNTWEFINNKKGFKQEGNAVSITDFLFEGENVWFGTDEFVTPRQPEFNVGGLYRYNRKIKWDKIDKSNGLPGNGIYCLEKTGNVIWAGVYSFDKNEKAEYGKGLIMIDRFTGKVTPVDLNLLRVNTSTITTLYFDGKDLWIGTDKGLYRLKIANPLALWTLKKPQTKKATNK